MKILLFGANGQLGSELSRTLPSLGEVRAYVKDDLDLTNHASIKDAIDSFLPQVIVNAAAYTNVEKAESEREIAFKVNAEAVNFIAKEAAKRDIWLIHFSTDYVFDGTKEGPYLEEDIPNPLNVYGWSKLAGDQAIIASKCKHLIFRVSWVIGNEGKNFVKTILRLAKKQKSLKVVNDQYGVPTTPALISKVLAVAIHTINRPVPWESGIYNLVPHGKTTWFEIAKVILKLAKKQGIILVADESSLYPINTNEYVTCAKRPLNSLLNTSKLEKKLSFNLVDWKNDFLKVTREIIFKEIL